MEFMNGVILWHLFWVVPLFLAAAVWGAARKKTLMKRIFFAADGISELDRGKRFRRSLLLFCALICLFLAAARPVWGEKILPETVAGRDILVVCDVSRSMLSDNVRPTRLEHAKQLMRELSEQNPSDRFGLIAFAGGAELICPLTADLNAFRDAANGLSADSAKRGGTDLEKALETALAALSGAEGIHPAVVVLSDGGELEGDSQKAIAGFQERKIPVFTLGIGEPGSPALVMLKDEKGGNTLLKDRDGNTVKTPLEESALQKIAQETGGKYWRSTTLDPGLPQLEKQLRALTPAARTAALKRKIDRAAWPLGFAFLFLLLYFLAGEIRKRSAVAAALTLCALLTPSANAEEPAIVKEETAAPPAPAPENTDARTLYNQGVKLLEEGRDDESAALFEKAASDAGNAGPLRAAAYQNLGVSTHKKARTDMDGAEKKLAEQNLDAAKKELDDAAKKLDGAEENYRESMRTESGANADGIMRNQTILLRERKDIQEKKKKIEELEKQLQKAQDETRQAHQDQKEQKQDSQKNQQQTSEARQAAEDLANQAKDLKQEKQENAARRAAENLKKAEQEQRNGDEKAAEKSLADAMRELGLNPENGKPDQPQKKPDQAKDQEKKPDQQAGKPSAEPEKPEQQPKQGQNSESDQTERNGKESKEKTPEQQDLESRAEMMRRQNRDFKEELEEKKKSRVRITAPEKDW